MFDGDCYIFDVGDMVVILNGDENCRNLNSGDNGHNLNSGDNGHNLSGDIVLMKNNLDGDNNSDDNGHNLNGGDNGHNLNSGDNGHNLNSGDNGHNLNGDIVLMKNNLDGDNNSDDNGHNLEVDIVLMKSDNLDGDSSSDDYSDDDGKDVDDDKSQKHGLVYLPKKLFTFPFSCASEPSLKLCRSSADTNKIIVNQGKMVYKNKWAFESNRVYVKVKFPACDKTIMIEYYYLIGNYWDIIFALNNYLKQNGSFQQVRELLKHLPRKSSFQSEFSGDSGPRIQLGELFTRNTVVLNAVLCAAFSPTIVQGKVKNVELLAGKQKGKSIKGKSANILHLISSTELDPQKSVVAPNIPKELLEAPELLEKVLVTWNFLQTIFKT